MCAVSSRKQTDHPGSCLHTDRPVTRLRTVAEVRSRAGRSGWLARVSARGDRFAKSQQVSADAAAAAAAKKARVDSVVLVNGGDHVIGSPMHRGNGRPPGTARRIATGRSPRPAVTSSTTTSSTSLLVASQSTCPPAQPVSPPLVAARSRRLVERADANPIAYYRLACLRCGREDLAGELPG